MAKGISKIRTSEFKDIMQKGAVFYGDLFIVRYINNQSLSRFSVSVPKKVAKNATLRNFIKRRIYSAIDKIKDRFFSYKDVVLIVKNGTDKISFIKLTQEIEKIFVKCGFLK